jgi:hypothetical protein
MPSAHPLRRYDARALSLPLRLSPCVAVLHAVPRCGDSLRLAVPAQAPSPWNSRALSLPVLLPRHDAAFSDICPRNQPQRRLSHALLFFCLPSPSHPSPLFCRLPAAPPPPRPRPPHRLRSCSPPPLLAPQGVLAAREADVYAGGGAGAMDTELVLTGVAM